MWVAQWLSGRMLDSRPRGQGFKLYQRHCVLSLSKNINPSLVLVQPRKTHPYLSERLLIGCKESNQTKLAVNQDWHDILCFLNSSWSLFQVQSNLPLSIINYGISKHYAGSQVIDSCPLDYLFTNLIAEIPIKAAYLFLWLSMKNVL